ncbi:MAG: sel1 repeat family protein, partial [Firmicutes bacterium]|nr:sel1 repeat family protein [Bacillota bacterium]
NLGNLYSKGRGVERDQAESARWYKKAAEQGFAKAQFNLGYDYANGEGVAQDYAEAARWYKQAAEQGHASAQFNLAQLYEKGSGVEQDLNEALRWFEQAAAQDSAGAGAAEERVRQQLALERAGFSGMDADDAETQYDLGNSYYYGVGVERDYAEAFHWYEKAAAQGLAWAQKMLGELYYYGRGVEENDA